MRKTYIQFARKKGKGGLWTTAGFIHLKEGIINLGSHTDKLSKYELMPERFFSIGSFLRRYGELKRKRMIGE